MSMMRGGGPIRRGGYGGGRDRYHGSGSVHNYDPYGEGGGDGPQGGGSSARGPTLPRGVCFDFAKTGTCPRQVDGAPCPFEHRRMDEIDFSSVESTSGPVRRRAGPRAFASGQPHVDTSRLCALLIDKIPVEQCTEESVRATFSPFGTIRDVEVGLAGKFHGQARVLFSAPEEAMAAYRCPEVFFNNRFVKLHWDFSSSLDQPSDAPAFGAPGAGAMSGENVARPQTQPQGQGHPAMNVHAAPFVPGRASMKWTPGGAPASSGMAAVPRPVLPVLAGRHSLDLRPRTLVILPAPSHPTAIATFKAEISKFGAIQELNMHDKAEDGRPVISISFEKRYEAENAMKVLSKICTSWDPVPQVVWRATPTAAPPSHAAPSAAGPSTATSSQAQPPNATTMQGGTNTSSRPTTAAGTSFSLEDAMWAEFDGLAKSADATATFDEEDDILMNTGDLQEKSWKR